MSNKFLSIIALSTIMTSIVGCGHSRLPSANQYQAFSPQNTLLKTMANPMPTATSDHSVVERSTFNGLVKDQAGNRIDGAIVKVSSLNASVPYQSVTTTVNGSYAFNNAPVGVQIVISAYRQHMGKAQRVEIVKANKQGDPSANRFDIVLPGVK